MSSTLRRNTLAVTEIIGALFLLTLAVAAGGIIMSQVLPVPLPEKEINAHILGYTTNDGIIALEHMGGETLYNYEIVVEQDNEVQRYRYEHQPWDIGQIYFPPIDYWLFNETHEVRIQILYLADDGSQQTIFEGKIYKELPPPPLPLPGTPMLISSLRTNSIDEDLICYDNGTLPRTNISTYIYRWMVNGESYAKIIMPFDNENTTCAKDYSGNGYHGTLVGPPLWTENGKVGGALHFGGSSDYITQPLPSFFNDLSTTDITISVWITSDDVTSDHRYLLQAGTSNSNFLLLFQYGAEIHFGVCSDGIKRAVRTDTIQSNVWYHITAVWDASEAELKIYLNSTLSDEVGYRNYAMGLQDYLDIGHGSASSRFWWGMIDELQIFARALSPEQIDQMYRSTVNGPTNNSVIVSEETTFNQVWQVIVTPSDGYQDQPSIETNILRITPYAGGA